MAGGRFSVEAIFRLKDDMSRIVGKISGRMEKFTRKASRGLRNLDRRFAKVGQTIKRTALLVTGVAGAAGLALKNIAGTGADFEQAITNVGAVSLKSRDQIAELEAKALELGASTMFSATQVAEGMEIMARAGFDTTQTIDGIQGVLDAAAASGLEMAEVAETVAGTLKGMGLEAEETARVADVLALASARTKSTIGSLGEGMKNVASTARQLGIPLEEVVAGVALLQDVGLDASVSGSALNTMLTKLAAPSKSLRREFKKLGIAFETDGGKALPFADILANLKKGADKAGGNMKQVAFLTKLVGLRGQKAAANLADLFSKGKVTTLTKELEKAKGSAAAMAKIRMDTLKGDLLKLEAATEGVKIALFDLEGGPLRDTVKGFTEWTDANKDLIVSGAKDFIADLRKNMDTIVAVLKAIGTGLVVFFTLAAAVKVARLAVAIYQGVLVAAKVAQWLFNASVKSGKFVMDLWRAGVWLTNTAMLAMGGTTGGVTGALNLASGAAKRMWLSLMGPVGLVIGVGAIAAAMTLWIAKVTGLDKALINMLGTSKNFNAGIKAIGETLGIQALVDAAEGNERRNASDQRIGVSTTRGFGGATDDAQVVTPQARVSREINENTTTNKDEIGIKVTTDSGTTAEVTKKPSRAGVKLETSGAF